MTMTPTNQTPSECKHYQGGVCARSKRCYRQCLVKCGVNCPDYQPKEKKDNENK